MWSFSGARKLKVAYYCAAKSVEKDNTITENIYENVRKEVATYNTMNDDVV